MVSTKFQDKALHGLLVGISIIKLLRGEFHISRSVRRTIKAIQLDFLILRNFGKEGSDVNFMWKDVVSEKNKHFHFFPKNDRIGVGLVITDETKPLADSKRHIPVDNQKFFDTFGKETESYFKNEQEILDSNTTKLDNHRVITFSPEVTGGDVRKKILILNLEEHEKEVSVDEFKKMKYAIGITINEENKTDKFVVKKEDKIYCFDFEGMRKIALELFPILNENDKGSVDTF